MDHIFFHCPLYSTTHSKLIQPLLDKKPHQSEAEWSKELLKDEKPQVSFQTGKFCAHVIQAHQKDKHNH